jgi:hypothetical protein
MFSPSQLRWWTSAHLKSRAWYLECPPEFTPLSEERLKRSIDSQDVVLEYDEFSGLDEDARLKAVKKREEVDKRIAIKNFDAVEKALQRITKKTARVAEKEKEKSSTKTMKQLVAGSSIVDQGSQF